MSPLKSLMNYSAEATQTSSFFSKNIKSRFLTAASIPLELLAIVENTFKLPFQSAALTVKIPAKILNVFVNSASLKEFESQLPGPLEVLKTALKIIGYAIGTLFTMSFGILAPYKNFQLHCSFGLISNQKAEKDLLLAQENRKKEIASFEEVIKMRLCNIVEAMRQKNPPIECSSPIELPSKENLQEPEIDQIQTQETEVNQIPAEQTIAVLPEHDTEVLQESEPIQAQEIEPQFNTDASAIEEIIQEKPLSDAHEELHNSPPENNLQIVLRPKETILTENG